MSANAHWPARITALGGNLMNRLNTHSIYDLAVRVHPLTEINYMKGTKLGSIFWRLVMAMTGLKWFAGTSSFFSPSLKRSVGTLLRSIHDIGVPAILPWEGPSEEKYNPEQVLESWDVSGLVQSAKDFETALANELSGLAIYHVWQNGIYSTDDLLMRADLHVPESVRKQLPEKATQDIREAGKCLGLSLATASAFHMWRALDAVMDVYHKALTGKTFEEAKVTRNWGAYVKALETAGAEEKITRFLDHISEEYCNPISHPSESLLPEDAFNLFTTGLSVISQAMKAAMARQKSVPKVIVTLTPTALPVADVLES